MNAARALSVLMILLAASSLASASQGVHYTYLWHLEQPIYWPAPDASGVRYERAWESIQAKDAGAAHPENDLIEIFGKDDRVAAYQWRVKESLASIAGHPEAGAAVSYSGGLIENIQSLGEANQLGYSPSWNQSMKEAQALQTSQGTPRLDMVIFSFHHALLPLIDDRVVRRQLELYQAVYGDVWLSAAQSKGLFPSEMAFSERLIPALVDAGLEWVIVSNAHLSRACADYPFVAGSGGDNIPPPNPAVQLNPAQGSYNRISIDRGVSPANAYPFAYQPHYARHVDPETGQAYKIVVVPAAQAESWKDGYSCYGLDEAAEYAGSADPDHPILVLMAHDGDNAFGGGFSYYLECVPTLAGQAADKGLVPSSIAGYLKDHPVDPDDVVKVEDGAWVNADGDFGAPSFWNWSWPLMNDAGQVDLANGWAEDQRNFAVITAATNAVLTAEDLVGPSDIRKILYPTDGADGLEQAWHFLFGALNSGYMYYGKVLDMELKPVVGSNEALARADQASGGFAGDDTPPTMFIPQRYPDNPGGPNFGPLYKYQLQELASDTWFWTFAFDVSGITEVSLEYRLDGDGSNDMGTDHNETYAGGADVGAWQSLPMTLRVFPKGNVTDDPEIDTSILPTEIADLYYAQLTGVQGALVDYHVRAVDSLGNVARSPIQHVWIGEGGAAAPGVWEPPYPDCDDVVTVRAEQPGWLHWGVDGWQEPPPALWPPGSEGFGDGKSIESPLAPCGEGYCVEIGPFGELASRVDFVFHFEDGSWVDNGGSDYLITISPCGGPNPDPGTEPQPEPTPDAMTPDAPPGHDAGGRAETIAGQDGAGGDHGGAWSPSWDAGAGGSRDGGGSGGCAVGAPEPTPALGLLLALALGLLRSRRLNPRID